MLATSTHAALADQYLDRLAFSWKRRSQALDSHVLDAAGLSALDRDLESYSRAIQSIGTAASTLMRERLLEPLTRGELYAIARHAIHVQDQLMHKACIGLIKSLPTLRTAYVAALEWSTSDGARWAICEWQNEADIQNGKGSHLYDVLALSACRFHVTILAELCTTSWWSSLIKTSEDHADSVDTTCALMQLGLATAHPQAVDTALPLLRSPVGQLRCLAAEVMLWRTTRKLTKYDAGIAEQGATDVLLDLSTGPLVETSVVTQASYALACWNYAGFDTVLSSLAAQTDKLDLYLQSLGWSGNSRIVSTLIDYLNHPEHARGAGAALSMLTGSLPARDGWQAEPGTSEKASMTDHPVDRSATIPAAKRYADLPPPHQAGFERWWGKHKARFDTPSRWLGGVSDTDDNLIAILQSGKLAWRAVAARRLDARLPRGASLNVSAPMPQQRQWISDHIASQTLRNAA